MNKPTIVLIWVVAILAIGYGTWNQFKPVEDPCLEIASSAKIIGAEKQLNGELWVDAVANNSDKVTHLTYASTTPKRVADQIKEGREMVLCMLIK